MVNHRRASVALSPWESVRASWGRSGRVYRYRTFHRHAEAVPLPRSPSAPIPWGGSLATYRVSPFPRVSRGRLPLRRIDGGIRPRPLKVVKSPQRNPAYSIRAAARPAACSRMMDAMPGRCAKGRVSLPPGRLSLRDWTVGAQWWGGGGVTGRLSRAACRWTRGRCESRYSRPWCYLVRNYYVYLVRYVGRLTPQSRHYRFCTRPTRSGRVELIIISSTSPPNSLHALERLSGRAVILSTRARLVWRDRARLY